MDAIESLASRVEEFDVAQVPVGKSALLLTGLGLNEALVPVVSALLRGIPLSSLISGGGLAFLARLGPVKRILGPTMSNVLMATAIAVGIDNEIDMTGKVRALVSSIVPGAGAATSGVPAQTAGAESSPAVGLGQAEALTEQERRILSSLRT